MSARKGPRSWKPKATIDLSKPKDVRYWTTRLNLSADELRTIVEDVGDRAAAVATVAGVALTGPGPLSPPR